MDNNIDVYLKANEELEKQKEQYNSVKDKNPQFRLEHRFPQSTRHYEYFLTAEDAKKSDYRAVNYGMLGGVRFQMPLSSQLQKKGPRGGWSKYVD
jgi:hypothetical protein